MRKPVTTIRGAPLRGGVTTAVHRTLLPPGAFSDMRNMRGRHPGLEPRAGQKALHTTADGTNQVMTLFQFDKTDVSETHLFAQVSDGDVLDATNQPPAVTTGAFGSEVHDGTATNMVPASWSVLHDVLVYSNGSDMHQVYGGDSSLVDKAIVCKDAGSAPAVEDDGEDYSTQVRDGDSTTYADLSDLDTFTNGDCLFVRTPVGRVKAFYITVSSANGNTSVMSVYYAKADGTYAAVSGISDGTDPGTGKTLAQSGKVSFTAPTNNVPQYLYGSCGWWWQFRFSAQLGATVHITKITYESEFGDLVNVWDGVPITPPEVFVEGTSQWEAYSPGAVEIGDLAAGKKIVVLSPERLKGIYIDVQGTPNASGTSVSTLKTWTGSAFASVGTVTDGTNGVSNTGWMTFPEVSSAQKTQFKTATYWAYAYEITFDSALSSDMTVIIEGMPYFDIDEAGAAGHCNASWKSMMAYTFDRFGEYVYITPPGLPYTLNGPDYGILVAGDGRANRVLAMRNFHNELLVWQEERGADGGCVTLFEGYNPKTFGKLLLSTVVGVVNEKAAVVVDGVLTTVETINRPRTMAFWISRYGVCATDGRAVSIISDPVRDYFDPTQSNCIRRGYEGQHWIAYDSAYHVLRIGLVTGSTATTPNTFLVFDLVDHTWSFDDLGQALACQIDAGAGSGDKPVVQVAGGAADGKVYLVNDSGSTDDAGTDITARFDMEVSAHGEYFLLEEILLRHVAQAGSSNNITVTIYKNGVQECQLTFPTAPALSGQLVRRHRRQLSVPDEHITVRVQCPAGERVLLTDMGLRISLWKVV